MPALLAGCGDDGPTTTESGQAPPTTTAGAPSTTTAANPGMRDFVGLLTSNDGYKYAVTLSIASQPATAGPNDCPPVTPAVTGTATYPVTLTVKNEAADRPAPFPPLRIEMTSGGAVPPQQVMVRAASGTCTFTPRVNSIGPGESVVFKGTSPAIATGAAPGSVGKIQVSASETTFSVAAPVP